MIMKQDLIKRIRDYFGLNVYEAKVWIALLSKGIASAGEVAELSSVPRSRTYDVLESLEKMGFAITKIGKPVKYIAVKPTEVIEKIKSNTLREAQERVVSLSNLKSTPEYADLEQLHKSGISPIKAYEITGSLRGRANILSRLKEVLENAKREIFICTTDTDFEDKSRILAPVLEKAQKKDIRLKIALFGDAERIKKINTKFNIKAKSINSVARLFMADKNELVFMITPLNSEEEIAIWLNSQFFTESIQNIIENSIKAQVQ